MKLIYDFSSILIFFLFINNISCNNDCENCVPSNGSCRSDSDSGNCLANCKTSSITATNCYFCNFDSTHTYYSIEGESCNVKENCQKLVYGTKECVSSCNDYYELGDYCYREKPENTEEEENNSKALKCKYKYFITEHNGIKQYNCLGREEDCPSDYYSYHVEEKLCFKGTCDSLNINHIRTKEIFNEGATKKYQCSSSCESGDYYKTDGDKELCVESCEPYLKYEESGNKICISFEECKNNLKYKKNLECVNLDTCAHFYQNECKDSCEFENAILYNVYGSKECIPSCTDQNKYLLKSTKTCYETCPSGYISEDGTKCIEESEKENCFYIESENPKKCYSECPQESPFHNDNDKKCLVNCKDNNNQNIYYEYNKKICYDSMKGDYFSENNNGKECYSDESICISLGYKYIKGANECVSSCLDTHFKISFTLDSLGDIQTLGKCLTKEDCQSNNYYYNSDLKECWLQCPDTMLTNEKDENGHPKETSGNTCVFSCSAPLLKLSSNICKETCAPNEYYDPDSSEPNKCIEDCGNKKIGPNNECMANCPHNYYYINDNGKLQCTDSEACPDNYYLFENDFQCYKQCSKIVNNNLRHYFYNSNRQCLNSCKDNNVGENKKYGEDPTDGPKECKELGGNYYYEKDNIIRENCILYESEGSHKCVQNCPFKVENNICVSSCSTTNQFFIETTIEILGETSHINKCVSNCNGKFILRNNNQCMETCNEDFYYIVGNSCYLKCSGDGIKYLLESNFECSDSCGTEKYEKLSEKYLNVYICKDSCGDKPYFRIEGENTECLLECPRDKNYIGSNNECKHNCNDENTHKNYIIENKKDLYNIYKCIDSCPDNYYYSEEEHQCFSICLESNLNKFSLIDNDNKRKCVDGCVNSTGDNLFYNNDTKICILTCEDNLRNKYHIDGKYNCIDECPENYYKLGYTCFQLCPSNKPYLKENNECVEYCPHEKPYFIEEFKHGEIDIQKRCLNDCTDIYPYYTETTISSNINYICKDSCLGPYIVNNSNRKAKKCLTETSCINGYYTYDNNNKIECYSICPIGKYYIDFNQYSDYTGSYSRKCLRECPSDFYFHEDNSYKCIKPSDCNSKIADYDTRTCVNKCSKDYISEIIVDSSLTAKICLSSCNSIYGPYLTPEKKCVSNCDTSKFLKNDNSFICKCQKLYYYDDSNIMICIDPIIEKCKNNNNAYKINKAESQECLKVCKGILSLNEDICYENNYDCSSFDSNTELIVLSNGQKKCNCKYKYYFEDGIKYCLGENDNCPPGQFYIPETNGCERQCNNPYLYKFNNEFCLRICPDGSTENDNICTCEKYWYTISNKNFICLEVNECPKSHPLINPLTNQCLKECRGSSSDILFIDKCVSVCDSIPNTSKTSIPEFASEFKFANYYCLCNNVWYYDITEKTNKCSSTETTCSSFYPNSRYIVKDTKQCVTSCPYDYPYRFNSECLHQCEMHIDEYYIKTVSNSKICQCINLWKYNANDEIECIKLNFCPNSPDHYVQIIDTKQCLPGDACPPESPLLFNRKCYKKNNCPENSYYNSSIEGTCVCNNLWYKYIDPNINTDFIFCLPKDVDRCPMHSDNKYPYQIFRTKECLKEGINCPQNSYIFNYICYENSCPLNTTEDESSFDSTNNLHYCICDTTVNYWYKYLYDETNREYLKCGLEKCEGGYSNLYIKGNECLRSCHVKTGEQSHDPMVSFRGICYEECPDFTKPKIDFIYECGFYKLEEANSLEQLRQYANIQVRELYETANIGGYLYNNSETSVQIYGIDKENNIMNRDLIVKSNLAYIDLDTCTNKIYEDNKMSDDDKILVIKYDLLSIEISENTDQINNNEDVNNYYLINPVEYEFFSSNTGEKIDASICDPNEIIISYPISYTINKYNDFIGGMNNNEYKKKFEIGKELNHKNKDVDIFNFNNTVYQDICTPIEINGKDLVLEDRYQNLYPNNITLCEENCTFYYTDYELGRINCKCNYKKELDFHRQYPESSDLLNSPDFYNPPQSGANAEIIKCLSKFQGKDSIIKNEAFYYCAVITLAEISMVFVAAFHGIKSVSINIANLLSKFNIKTNMGNNFKINNNKLNNEKNIISTSHRILNNPPRKGNNDINIEEEKKSEVIGNIINKKNIAIMNYNKNNIDNEYETNNNNDAESEDINYGIQKKK